MTLVRVGVIGCGRIARTVHLPSLRRLPEVEIVAIAEPDAASRSSAERLVRGARAVAGHAELLAMPEVEAAVVCAPTATHAELGCAVLEAGKHLYLEKPIATTLDDARRLLDAHRAGKMVAMAGFNYRFHPLHVRLAAAIGSGRIGDVVAVRAVLSGAPTEGPEWTARLASGGGALLDLASHQADLLYFLLGSPVAAVKADVRSLRTEGDTVLLQLRLENGVPVQLLCSASAVEEDRIEVYGTGGKLTVDRHLSLDVEHRPAVIGRSRSRRLGVGMRGLTFGSIWRSPVLLDRLRSPTGEPSFRAAFAAFAGAIRGRSSSPPDLSDGFRSLAVVDAARRAMDSGGTEPVVRQ